MNTRMARILIVDDEVENREALKRALGDENGDWFIQVAENETDGLTLLRNQQQKGEPIDVVLTDLVMRSEQSGMTMLEEARKIDPLVMAILFTAKEKSLDRYKAFDYGAFDVVEKNIRGTTAVREINIKTRAALRYREWSQRINYLRRYFDPKLFDAIGRDPSVLELGQRTVTIVFWDIRGFSLLCEILKAHPDLIAGFLKEYCQEAAQVVFRHGGVLDKFIGDGVMALFGALSHDRDSDADHAANAVRAGLELRDRFNRLVAKWMPQWTLYTPQNIEIGIGCGIHTGEVLVGNVGTDFRDQFTALGSHVNLAARIEGESKHGQVLMSQTTQGRVISLFELAKAEKINDIKNIPGEFQLYNAVSAKRP